MNKIRKESGFTLLEVMIAMALGLILLPAAYTVFISQQKAYTIQDQVAETMQNNRVGLSFLIRDMRMAGYDPERSELFGFTDSNYNARASATTVATNQEIYMTIDDDGDGVIDDNTSEKIGYRIVDAYDNDGILDTLQVDQRGTGWQPLAENIVSLTFTYTYEDGGLSTGAAGLPNNTDGDVTNDFQDIRLIELSLVARTSKEDPSFTDGFNLTGSSADGTCRTRTLTAKIRPRNLGIL